MVVVGVVTQDLEVVVHNEEGRVEISKEKGIPARDSLKVYETVVVFVVDGGFAAKPAYQKRACSQTNPCELPANGGPQRKREKKQENEHQQGLRQHQVHGGGGGHEHSLLLVGVDGGPGEAGVAVCSFASRGGVGEDGFEFL